MRTLALVIFLACSFSTNAQQKILTKKKPCGTPEITIGEAQQLPYYGNNVFLTHYVDSLTQVFGGGIPDSNIPVSRVEANEVWYRVPVRFIMAEWNGVNALRTNQAETERIYKAMIQNLNDAMRRNNVPIRFYMLCTQTVQQYNAVYGSVDCFSFFPRLATGSLDCYIVNEVKDAGGIYCVGFSGIILPRNSIFSGIYQEDALNPTNTTFIHEVGHWLGLYHTHNFSGTLCVKELVTRGNVATGCPPFYGRQCERRGDFLCDTEADPNLDDNSSRMVGCRWIPGLLDSEGDQFRPDPRNFMSYSSGICQTVFTGQQRAVMLREVTRNNPSYTATFTQDFDTYEPNNTPAMASGIQINGGTQEHSFDMIGNTVLGGCVDNSDWIKLYNKGDNINDLYLDVTSPSGLIASVEFWNTNNIVAGIEKLNQIPLTTINLSTGAVRYVIPCSLLSGSTGTYLFHIVRSGVQTGEYTVALSADLPVVSGTGVTCSGGAGSYTVFPVPPGATITWQGTGANIISGQGTPNALVSVGIGVGTGTVQATVTGCGTSYTTPPFSVLITGTGLDVNYHYSNGTSIPLGIVYTMGDTENPNTNNICAGYIHSGYLTAGVAPSSTVTFAALGGITVSYRSPTSAYINLAFGAVGRVRVSTTNLCGTVSQTFTFRATNCGTPNPPGNPNPPDPCSNPPRLYNISPNPASAQINIGISAGISEKPMEIPCPRNPRKSVINSKDGITFSQVNIYNSFGILVLSKQMDKAKEFVIPLNELRAGLYLVQISEGEYIERHQIIIE